MSALLIALLACSGADKTGGEDSGASADTADSGDTGDSGGTTDTADTADTADSSPTGGACELDGPQALFTGTDGASLDLTEIFLAAAPDAPIEVGLYDPGLLTICPGEWHIYIRVESDVVIRGAGAASTTLDAGRASAVIRTKGDYQLDVQGLTLRGGLSQHGGGLYATNGASLRVTDCVIEDNTVDLDGHGGGICVSERSEAALVGVTFRGNSASEGGGLAVMDSAASLVDVVFEDNAVEGSYFPGYGGGLFTEGSTVAINGATFRGNHAASDGGGMAVWYGSTVSLQDSAFTGNTASDGAGLHVLFGEVTASGLELMGNTAEGRGGGAQIRYGALTLSASELSDNAAGGGGGLALEEASLALSAVEVTGNRADEGGGLYLGAYSVASGVDCELSSNTPDDLFHSVHGAQTPGASFTCDSKGCR